MTFRLPLLLGISALVGCARGYDIYPVQGGEVGEASAHGVTVYADAEAWDAAPYDLPRYLTPIAVQLVNESGREIRVTYADFALTNSRGFRFAAINPYTGRVEHRGIGDRRPGDAPALLAAAGEQVAVGAAASVRNADDEATVHLAQARRRVPAQRHVRRPLRGTTRAIPRRHVHSARRRVHSHFFVHPRWHAYFDFYSPWPGDPFYPRYYSSYVYGWSPAYYPAEPTQDVLRRGLPEGVIKPGGTIAGFIYFQNALRNSRTLELTWEPHTPDGEKVASLAIQFLIER